MLLKVEKAFPSFVNVSPELFYAPPEPVAFCEDMVDDASDDGTDVDGDDVCNSKVFQVFLSYPAELFTDANSDTDINSSSGGDDLSDSHINSSHAAATSPSSYYLAKFIQHPLQSEQSEQQQQQQTAHPVTGSREEKSDVDMTSPRGAATPSRAPHQRHDSTTTSFSVAASTVAPSAPDAIVSSVWSILSRSKTFIISSMVESVVNMKSSFSVVNIILDLNVYSGAGAGDGAGDLGVTDNSSGSSGGSGIDFIDRMKPWCSPCSFAFVSNIDLDSKSIVPSGCMLLAAQCDIASRVKFRIDEFMSNHRTVASSTSSSKSNVSSGPGTQQQQQSPADDICCREVIIRHSVAQLCNILAIEGASFMCVGNAAAMVSECVVALLHVLFII